MKRKRWKTFPKYFRNSLEYSGLSEALGAWGPLVYVDEPF